MSEGERRPYIPDGTPKTWNKEQFNNLLVEMAKDTDETARPPEIVHNGERGYFFSNDVLNKMTEEIQKGNIDLENLQNSGAFDSVLFSPHDTKKAEYSITAEEAIAGLEAAQSQN